MKTIRMFRNYDYKPKAAITIGYIGGETYRRVPEAAVVDILKAKAGEVVFEWQEKKSE